MERKKCCRWDKLDGIEHQLYTVNKGYRFSRPSRDVTNQTLPGGEECINTQFSLEMYCHEWHGNHL
jgi:hypothetical protein